MNRVKVAGLVLSASTLVGLAINEGYRDTAYVPVPGDTLTIGFGETANVKAGDKTTPTRALVQLLQSAEKHADGVRACIDVPMMQYEFESAVSIAYNIGVNAFCKSTMVRKLNAGDYDGFCSGMLAWDKFQGKPLRGLTIRRQAEYRLCKGE